VGLPGRQRFPTTILTTAVSVTRRRIDPTFPTRRRTRDILREAADTTFVPDTAGHGDVIAGKGRTLEAIHTPGHTSNHSLLRAREESAVFTATT
jgi:glyoxylase-like metal-dependent hydrolase (beta-lactamase superfamily II)